MHEEKTVIDQRNKEQKNQEQKNQERICEYSFKEPEALRVAEALAENMETPPHVRSAAGRASDSENASRLAGAAAAKKQGEYTVDDYLALPQEQRAELIDGVIYDMAAPTYIHQAIGDRLQTVFNNYIEKMHGSCRAFTSPVDVQLDCDDRTMVQPDVLIVCDRSKFRKGRIYGAPDLIVEVLSPSTSKKDRILKLSKYKKAGVREYWIVDTDKKRVLAYNLEKGDAPVIYGFSDVVPVSIFGDECKVDFKDIDAWIGFMYDTM